MLAISVLLFSAISAPSQVRAESDALISMVKASLATNIAKTSQGRGSFDVTFQYDQPQKTARMSVNQVWSGDYFEQKIWLSDPDGYFFHMPFDQELDLTKPPDYVIMFHKKGLFAYFNRTRSVEILESSEREAVDHRAILLPKVTWFRCCAPSFGGGLTWAELIDVKVKINEKDFATGVMQKSGDKLVLERKDPKGTMRVIFDPAVSMNPTHAEYKTPKGFRHFGDLTWRKSPGGVFYLADLHFIRYVANDPALVDCDYHLVTRSIDLTPPPTDYLSESSFYSRLPKNVSLRDYTGGSKGEKRIIINPDTNLK